MLDLQTRYVSGSNEETIDRNNNNKASKTLDSEKKSNPALG